LSEKAHPQGWAFWTIGTRPKGHQTCCSFLKVWLMSNDTDLKTIQVAGAKNGDPDFVRR
jgi:hypothetical protein